MSIFSNKSHLISAYLCTIIICFLLCFLFAAVYTVFPLTLQIIPFFSNLSLGLAVFFGAFYLAHRTPFFLLRNIIGLTLFVLLTVFCCSALFGTVDFGILLRKGIWILFASVVGECGGRL